MITDFRLPDHERALLDKIVERAVEELEIKDVQCLDMDLTACHKYDTPLDLERLLAAPFGDFGHDVHGISRYIDRSTGKLTDHFCPRLAFRKKKTSKPNKRHAGP